MPSARAGKLSILTNKDWFDGRERSAVPIEAHRIDASGPLRILRLAAAARGRDAVVINGAPGVLRLFCLLKRVPVLSRMKLVSVDLVLPTPSTLLARFRVRLTRLLFRAVDLFIVFCKETADLERLYGVRRDRTRYIPFKVNALDEVLAMGARDEGYILACGRTYRDYDTFGRAMQGLPYPAYILTQPDELAEHGGRLDSGSVPDSVTVIRHDGSQRSWLDWIAGAQFVVLPILPGVLNPAGISVYLVAMALGKCVVITEGPGTRGILEGGEAVVVAPGDPHALRAAIVKVREDAGFRARVGRAGREYALSLGGEDRLAEDVVRLVVEACRRPETQRRNLLPPQSPRVPTSGRPVAATTVESKGAVARSGRDSNRR